jgi:hypothetical protein
MPKELSPGPPFARTPARKLEQFDRAFEAEMDEILIKPDWFEKWEEEIPEGAQFDEEMVRRAMDKLRGGVVPQLIGQWLFVLGNACKNARLKWMRAWEEFVEAYHVLIGKLIMSDAYAVFTNSLMGIGFIWKDWRFGPGTTTPAQRGAISAIGQTSTGV